MAVACGSHEPSRQDVARAELCYCESPHPLEWAPDAPTFHVMLRREYPTMSGEPRWEPIPGDVYSDAAQVAGRYSGGEPPEWQNEFVDPVRYFGPGDLDSLRTAIRNALRE